MSQKEELTNAQFFEQVCRFHLETYIETQNPIWAFQALFHWVSPQWGPKPESFPLPRELLEFLVQTLAGINNLAFGMKPFEYQDGEILDDGGSLAIKASEACDFLPEALRLRGKKWNAFLDYEKDRVAGYLMEIKDQARDNGASERQAMEQVMLEAGTTDERTARRKLKGGRGPRQKSPYPAPKWLDESSGAAGKVSPIAEPARTKRGTKQQTTGAKKS
ncbi:MAG: hypothetical protein INF79_12730 [Roseomonas sp.]|nr:hypothetical protein [Roseomonas sp.]